jgi:hypothetical protein
MKKQPIKSIARLLARHNAELARGKARFDKASLALRKALSIGAICGQPIELPGGGKFVVNDNFTTRDVVYRPARFARYSVEPYRPEAAAGKARKSR